MKFREIDIVNFVFSCFQPKVSVVLKRLDDCMKFKEEGNALFKANSPAEAKNMYTKGIPRNFNQIFKTEILIKYLY